jgi:hypothetical protein
MSRRRRRSKLRHVYLPLIVLLFNWMFSGIPICTVLVVEVELLHEFGFNGFPDVAFYHGWVFFFGGSWSRRFDLIFLASFNSSVWI